MVGLHYKINFFLCFPLTGQSSVLSLLLEYYSSTFALREVKSHVLVVIHTHLAALPWHHLNPSLQDTLILCKV